MPCLFLFLVLLFPRAVLLVLFFFTNYLARAYHGLLLPLLGFIFLPLTTLAYAWIVNSGMPTRPEGPPVSETVVVGFDAALNDTLWVMDLPVSSVTVTISDTEPVLVGVPVTIPVVAFMLRPMPMGSLGRGSPGGRASDRRRPEKSW